jgi:hypothetical protein
MPVKFKLGFTIDAKTLFGIMSQFLPVQDLSVEEVIEREPDPAIRFDQRFDLPKPKRAPQVRKTTSKVVNLHAGMNAIIMSMYRDGEVHPSAGLRTAFKAGGYSVNGLHGKLNRLCYHGYMTKVRRGEYQITPKGKLVWEQPPAAARENAA